MLPSALLGSSLSMIRPPPSTASLASWGLNTLTNNLRLVAATARGEGRRNRDSLAVASPARIARFGAELTTTIEPEEVLDAGIPSGPAACEELLYANSSRPPAVNET